LSRPSPINPGVEGEPKSNPSVILAKDFPIPTAPSTKVKRDGHHDNHNQHHNPHHDHHHDQHHDDHHGGHHKREALSPALVTPVPSTTAKPIAKLGEPVQASLPVPPVPSVHNADNTKFASLQRPARETPVASDNKDTKTAIAHKPLTSENSNNQYSEEENYNNPEWIRRSVVAILG